MSPQNLNQVKEDPAYFDYVRNELLGEQYNFNGKVVKNEMFDRKEFIINELEELKPEEIAKEVIEEINM